MKIKVFKSVRWKKIYAYIANKERKTKKKIELIFNENGYANLDFNLAKDYLVWFTNKKKRTEKIIISEAIDSLKIRYNRKTHKYDCLLLVDNCDSYGLVKTFSLKDEKNLIISKNNEKNIHVLLPNNYDSSKKYGLIIMIDGQNMYDTSKVGRYTKKNDPYGSWQIETTLNKIANIYHEEYIVCGIETTGIERMFELMPKYFGEFKNDCNLNSNLSKVAESGLLEKTGLFIMNRVIPFMKEKYSISDNIGIGGSSAGGNAAFHIGLIYYDVFKFILSFSPIFGCYEDEYLIDFYNKINFNKNKDNLPYFFFNVGKKGWLERCLWQENCNSLDLMVKCGYPEDKLFGYTEISAEHNEIMWRYAFNYFMNIYHKEKK